MALAVTACQQPLVPIAAATPAPVPRLWSGRTLFGAQTHLRRANVPYLRRIADAGFDAIRVSLVPWWAQSRHGGWMWTNYDVIYAWTVRRHMTPLFMLENPRSTADFPAMRYFVETAARRYTKALFELGNEPDNAGQWPGFYPPHARAPLTADAYWEIERPLARAWRHGNPHGRISTAGTSGMDLSWQRSLIAAIDRDGAFRDGTIDAIAVHAYGEPLPTRRMTVVRDLAALKAMLPHNVQVWVTEYGLPNPRPEDVAGWFATMEAVGVPVFCWYEAQDDILDGVVQPYGLVNINGTPKPAYFTARAFLQGRS